VRSARVGASPVNVHPRHHLDRGSTEQYPVRANLAIETHIAEHGQRCCRHVITLRPQTAKDINYRPEAVRARAKMCPRADQPLCKVLMQRQQRQRVARHQLRLLGPEVEANQKLVRGTAGDDSTTRQLVKRQVGEDSCSIALSLLVVGPKHSDRVEHQLPEQRSEDFLWGARHPAAACGCIPPCVRRRAARNARSAS